MFELLRQHKFPLIAALALAALSGCASSSSRESVQASQATQNANNTYDEETVLDAASDVFGEGAEDLAGIVEKVFADLGRPNAYVAGEEAGGGLVVGLRYGGGRLYHKIEGQREVHWTGPSIGIDAGADAAKTFILIYNLYDSEEIYRRFPAVEGQFYFIGGLGVSYYQRDNVIIAPIRLGVGLRATANVGYIKFTKEKTYNPF